DLGLSRLDPLHGEPRPRRADDVRGLAMLALTMLWTAQPSTAELAADWSELRLAALRSGRIPVPAAVIDAIEASLSVRPADRPSAQWLEEIFRSAAETPSWLEPNGDAARVSAAVSANGSARAAALEEPRSTAEVESVL